MREELTPQQEADRLIKQHRRINNQGLFVLANDVRDHIAREGALIDVKNTLALNRVLSIDTQRFYKKVERIIKER